MAPKHAQLQIFIQVNISVGKKWKIWRERPHLVSGRFIKVLCNCCFVFFALLFLLFLLKNKTRNIFDKRQHHVGVKDMVEQKIPFVCQCYKKCPLHSYASVQCMPLTFQHWSFAYIGILISKWIKTLVHLFEF